VPEQLAVQVILASQSPRRLELLRQIGVEPHVRPADIDESMIADETALDYVERMAAEKASVVVQAVTDDDAQHSVVLAADTIVVQGEHVLGKPKDKNDFERMMSLLSDTTHYVLTAVSCVTGRHQQNVVSKTEVKFGPIATALTDRYWASGEPVDKAGGYAIQGLGAVFVASINGSYSGVMGLPLFETSALLSDAYARIYHGE